ncbi:MAG: hypothetical protein U9N19_03125 [Thermodesulfobacteriota bacterium]|nr:hypothetical protein [Thermodesulfobacteriota bacterium]
MPIEVIQSTSDEGKGICRHVRKDLGGHHSPDLFHVQREIAKATGVALASNRRKAEKSLEKASLEIEKHREEQKAYLNGKPSLGVLLSLRNE